MNTKVQSSSKEIFYQVTIEYYIKFFIVLKNVISNYIFKYLIIFKEIKNLVKIERLKIL